MKNIKKIIYFFSLLLIVTSCSDRVTLPQYVTVETINSLQNGMSKTEVANKMSVSPFDAYHALQSGCELYSYKYVLNDQKIRPIDKDRRSGLKGNQAHYTQPKNVYVYFKDNRLVDIITDLGIDHGTDLADFGTTLESSCAGPISGCMDATALNYNKEANADNGSCEYCPCDQMKNPDYDPLRNCGDKCIPIESTVENGNAIEDDCTLCDIVKNASANTTINVTTVAPWEGTSVKKGSDISNAKSNTKALGKRNKKLERLNKSLAKSKAKDAKKGKISKKTKILQKVINKLNNNKK
mgnify:CR=1 FL=1|tara:strand:+ start:430 stop:1317 length:888 start_codon:yes stop_codon:yes gene_type:complete